MSAIIAKATFLILYRKNFWKKKMKAENGVPVAQRLEHCVSSAKVVGSIPREHTYWQYKCIAWMHCKSLWIKASAKCINVNVNNNTKSNSEFKYINTFITNL